MRSEFTEREEAELLNSHFAPVFLSSEQMRVSIYRDKYIKISHFFIIFFFQTMFMSVSSLFLLGGRKS